MLAASKVARLAFLGVAPTIPQYLLSLGINYIVIKDIGKPSPELFETKINVFLDRCLIEIGVAVVTQ